MTIATTTVFKRYTGNGATVAFSFPYHFFENGDLVVYLETIADGTAVLQVLDTNYTIAGADDPSGGTVTFSVAPASTKHVVIIREPDLEQSASFTSFSAGIANDALDRIYELLQLATFERGRAIRLSETQAAAALELPFSSARADKALGFDQNGDLEMTARAVDLLDDNLASLAAAEAAAAAALVSQSATANSASNAANSAANAASSAANALTAENNAETAETNAEAAQAAAEAARDAAIIASENPALTYHYSTLTTDADPGDGVFKLNNATVGSATVVYFDNKDADGHTVTGWLDAFDDSTNTTKGILLLKGIDTPTAFLVGRVSGSIVDGTGYRKVTIAVLSSGGSFVASERFSVLFAATGDAGNVTGPAGGVSDNEIALFNGATGGIIKGSGISAANILTESEAAAAYQPLDGDLTAIAAIATAAYGRSLLALANATALAAEVDSFFLTPTEGNAAYQPLDSDLTAIAALSTTSFGRSVLDRANAAALATLAGVGTGDSPQFTGIELGATDTTLTRGAAGVASVEGNQLIMSGKHTIWVPATAMVSRTTNGAASGTVELATNKNILKSLDFDTATQEFAQFEIHFPKSWNLGTVTFQPDWSHAATVTNFGVVWGLAGVARSDDDAGDVAFGTAQTSTDTGGTTNDIYVAPESAAITIAGTPAAGDTVQFQINRTVADGGDTMTIDARLHGVRLFYTVNAATDA